MADRMFVEDLVREMLRQTRNLLLGPLRGGPPELKMLVAKWAETLFAGNEAFAQTMVPEAQAAWLRLHYLGTDDPNVRGPVTALVAMTVNRFANAILEEARGNLDDEQLEFRLETAVEDCTCWAMGIENPAD
jgi:hypothetical protein